MSDLERKIAAAEDAVVNARRESDEFAKNNRGRVDFALQAKISRLEAIRNVLYGRRYTRSEIRHGSECFLDIVREVMDKYQIDACYVATLEEAKADAQRLLERYEKPGKVDAYRFYLSRSRANCIKNIVDGERFTLDDIDFESTEYEAALYAYDYYGINAYEPAEFPFGPTFEERVAELYAKKPVGDEEDDDDSDE